MSKVKVLIEIKKAEPKAFESFTASMESEVDIVNKAEDLVANLSGMGIEVTGDVAPVPMFAEKATEDASKFLSTASFTVDEEPDDKKSRIKAPGFASFDSETENPDMKSESMVVSAEMDMSKIDELSRKRSVVAVYPNSPLTLFGKDCGCGGGQHGQGEVAFDAEEGVRADPVGFNELSEENVSLFDLANSASAGIDCRPFRAAVSIRDIRILLGVNRVWSDGFRGQNTVVGIIDEGVSGAAYPVIGGFSLPGSARRPGSAPVSSHGSMCAADVLVGAPFTKLYDYPFLGVQNSGGALTMFQAVLDQRRINGTPHLTNNSYGFVGIPSPVTSPNHEVHNINHPLHRKIREVVASGCPSFFAAGNCGVNCPSGACHSSGIGPNRSINGTSSLAEVITIAAVNSRHERIGYSSQGRSFPANGFFLDKPDLSSYSHFFGNFGPGRPAGGGVSSFDNGTSAATPVAAGVAALLLSAFPGLSPQRLKDALIRGAINLGEPGWDTETGHGVINAAATYVFLRNQN